MKIEVHQLQNFAPSCLNRDDTNTPKSCVFGGRRRARISSQCLKRAIRLYLKDACGLPSGTRTRMLIDELAARLPEHDADEVMQRARHGCADVLMKVEDSEDSFRTQAALYLDDTDFRALADAVEADWEQLAESLSERLGKKYGKAARAKREKELPHLVAAIKAIGDTAVATDIALFGRMVAESTHMNIDAACQVAHAISTHAVEVETDFFTAVDDLKQRGGEDDADSGAGMMGIVEFNSACFYRYAVIDRDQLIANLRGDVELADKAIVAFLQGSIDALPTGRQNSSAAHNPPDFVEVVVNDGLPRSLANAFEDAVTARGSLVGASIDKLRQYAAQLADAYGTDGMRSRFLCTRACDGRVSRAELVAWLTAELKGGA